MSGFEYFIDGGNFHFKYAKGKPAVEGQEFHSYSELVLFLDGESQLISKNIQLSLEKGSLVLIERENFHQFVVTSPQNYVRCILAFEKTSDALESVLNEVVQGVSVMQIPPKSVLNVFESLQRVCASFLSEELKKEVIEAGITSILAELKLYSGESIDKHISLSNQSRQALNFIDLNFNKDITVQSVAKALNVSPSSLSHRFKDELNISVYRYISEKRLSEARKLISQGESLSAAAEKCGFKDYSCFFRLYKKRYSRSPSAHLK